MINYTIENEILKVSICDKGAELQSICKDGKEYLWQADPTYWDEKAPNIFPYVARLTQGKYVWNGREYHLPIHGFLPSSTLLVEEKSQERIVFRLDANKETLACYPFDFTYRVIYELAENELNITYQVENHGQETMYFGIGGHPGFAVPVGCGTGMSENHINFEDFYLEFSEDDKEPIRIGFSPTCFLTGKDSRYELVDGNRINLHHNMFDEDAIVLKNVPRCVMLKSDHSDHSVRVSFPDMDYIGFWHAVKTDAPYICIEPWSSLPSRQDVVEDISKQPDLKMLPGGGQYQNRWKIEIF